MVVQERSRKAFTLIELLVVIAIIAILAAILFPVFASARKKAQQTTCLNGQRQIGLALAQYTDDYEGRYPPTAGHPGNVGGKTFVGILMPMVKTAQVFMCPGAPKNGPGYDSGSDTIESPDTNWTWGTETSSYGYNGLLGGWDELKNNWGYLPTNTQVKEPSRTVAFCDARWVDLVGGGPRIGRARFRHQGAYVRFDKTSGGVNAIFADTHVRFVTAVAIIAYPVSTDGTVRWTWR
jgi:prepilin-type N-terminal cleavage/methylation domain-containing protein